MTLEMAEGYINQEKSFGKHGLANVGILTNMNIITMIFFQIHFMLTCCILIIEKVGLYLPIKLITANLAKAFDMSELSFR